MLCCDTSLLPVRWCPFPLRLGDLGSNIFGAYPRYGTGEVGSYLALLIGVGGAIGIYLGGRIADFMAAKRGQQWLPWVVAVSSLDYPSHALSDLYGDHTDGSNCRPALPAMLVRCMWLRVLL